MWPDTPVEVITDLLAKALKADDLKEVKDLVQQAQDVAGGLDPYLERMSSTPSQASPRISFQHALAGASQRLVRSD